jgi:hypothetical protein
MSSDKKPRIRWVEVYITVHEDDRFPSYGGESLASATLKCPPNGDRVGFTAQILETVAHLMGAVDHVVPRDPIRGLFPRGRELEISDNPDSPVIPF